MTALTHPERVLYPEQGITKVQLADYYRRIGELLLPHVANRPLALLRCPAGRQHGCFFQKHPARGLPESIHQVRVPEKSGKLGSYTAIEDLAGLLALVQLGVLEIHTEGARVRALDRPDLLVFDLDPDPTVAWERVTAAARQLRDQFARLDLQCFVKTTGGKGLHVCVPLVAERGWQEVESFSRDAANALARVAPDQFVATMSKAQRHDRIFVDYLRNARGATFVAPYSTRARPGAPVALPVAWEDLDAVSGSDQFTVRNLGRAWSVTRRDPWREMKGLRQSLTAARMRSFR